MRSTGLVALMGTMMIASAAAYAAPASKTADPAVHAVSGEMLTTADGARVGRVYQVNSDGSVQIIVDYSMVTVPASTLTMKQGQLTTSLTRNQIRARS